MWNPIYRPHACGKEYLNQYLGRRGEKRRWHPILSGRNRLTGAKEKDPSLPKKRY